MKERKKKEEIDLMPQYRDIMKNFDFGLVHEYMSGNSARRNYDIYGRVESAESWKIICSNGEYKVPTVEELVLLAKNLLLKVMERSKTKSYTYIHTGPFKASCFNGTLSLECIIESWDGI